MSFSIRLGNFLYKHAFWLYKPLYAQFKEKQDAYEIELLERFVHKGDTVLDIGANIGFYAGILSELVGETGKVHCFEPDPGNFSRLKAGYGSCQNLVLHNKAVGPQTGTIKIYTSRQLNVDHRTYKPDDYEKEIEIPSQSIDDFKEAGQINFIKMDIQGFEMFAMQGMLKTLDQNQHIRILSEFWPYGLKKSGSSAEAYFHFLRQRGFYVYLLKDKFLEELDEHQVKILAPMGEAQYFNILASRERV
ncbi:MAG TPA: FkbM family methyltransferase [Bacteroidia bacterium]|nr:FkbM family methyltransferase [Bacteroidia bacterium]